MEYELSEKQFNQLKDKGIAINIRGQNLIDIVEDKQILLTIKKETKFSNSEMKKIGNHLKSIRRDTGLSKSEFGKQIETDGIFIPESAINDWEQGKVLIPQKYLNSLFEKFDSDDELLKSIYSKNNKKSNNEKVTNDEKIPNKISNFIIKRQINMPQFIALFQSTISSTAINNWKNGNTSPHGKYLDSLNQVLSLNKNQIQKILSDEYSLYSIGQRIKNLMKLNSVRTIDIAEIIDIPQPMVSDVKLGYKELEYNQYQDLADFFGVSIDYILKGEK
ncbi:helix-turn-helix domain-containing protein [Fructilactobacillus frigidiflavus]|uniref:helix-turn-helix domain-containing protein n=1 Tax=Fructilactobacillus frigidiflavus TaxID=3242688 RepID=UPI0037569ED9